MGSSKIEPEVRLDFTPANEIMDMSSIYRMNDRAENLRTLAKCVRGKKDDNQIKKRAQVVRKYVGEHDFERADQILKETLLTKC